MGGRKIIVCIKQIPDPEGPPSAFVIDSQGKKVIPQGIPPVINPFDENALEAALRLKENSGYKVVAISMVEKATMAVQVLRKALAVGADELIILGDEHFKDLDSYSAAYVLSSAINKIDDYDLIFVGRQAADWYFGQVGLTIAEILHIPSISLAKCVSVDDGKVVVEKVRPNGYEKVKAPMPTLITMGSEIGDLRLPSVKDINDARKKPLTVWNMMDLRIEPHMLETRKISKLFFPPSRLRKCVFIDGQSPQEKGENLALKLREDKVI